MFYRRILVAAVAGGLVFAPSVAVSSGPPPTIQPVTEIRALAILAYFFDQTQPALSSDAVADVLNSSASSFFLENSYGQVSVSADVTDWVRLTMSKTCDTVAVLREAVAAIDDRFDFRQFQHVIVIAPYARSGLQPYCGWSGLASGTVTLQTADGTVAVKHAAVHSSAANLTVIAHELGHNLGLGHADFLDCGSKSWALTGCTVFEYADYYSVMGRSAPARDLSAYHRELLGWFDASRTIVTVDRSGTFTLTPIESADAGLKALKVPRPNGQPLYVEYRQSLGFDTGMDQGGFSDVFQGALLHLPRMTMHDSVLIDPTPPGEPTTVALKPGRTFTDPLTGTRVSILSRTAETLVLDVRSSMRASSESVPMQQIEP